MRTLDRHGQTAMVNGFLKTNLNNTTGDGAAASTLIRHNMITTA
jgi:hypothetical protein